MVEESKGAILPHKNECKNSPSRLSHVPGPYKSTLQDLKTRLFAFLDARSRVDEMPDLVLSPSWTQEVELTRCWISPSRLLRPKKSSRRDAGSRLLAFLDPRIRLDEMTDLSFLRWMVLRNISVSDMAYKMKPLINCTTKGSF